jgi:hypothetical protein
MNNKPTYDIASLPDLPEDWKCEVHVTDPDVIHISKPDCGAISINFRNRSIEGGWCAPFATAANRKAVAGRGWQAKLVNIAIAQYKEIWGIG